MSLWQVQVVPAENTNAEFEHYTDAQEEMLQLRSGFLNAVGSGATRSVTIQLRMRYPSRIFFVNNLPPTRL